MAVLVDAGVVDTGEALREAAGVGHQEAVNFLLRQMQTRSIDCAAYVNTPDKWCITPLFRAACSGRCSPRLCGCLLTPARTRHRPFDSPAPH